MKRLVLILLSFLLLTSLASAVTINTKETYSPGETLIAEIQGNFISPLQDKQIYFYEGRIPLPLLFDIGKFQDKYYLYALLPIQETNLSLVIKDANYIEATKEHKQDLMKNFSVSGNLVDFSVSPGFVITNQDFEIKVQSISKAVTVSTDFLGKQEQVYVSDSAIKKIKFPIQENSTLTELKISTDSISYTIPVLVVSNITLSEKVSRLKFSPSSRDIAMALNEERELNIRLENLGNVDLEDINFTIPEIFKTMLTIEPKNLSIKQDDSVEIILKIISDQEGLFSDFIEAEAENASAFFNLSLSVSPEIINASNGSQLPTCLGLEGQVCKTSQICNGTEADVVGGKCCLADCLENPTTSSSWIWILIIVMALLVIGYFLFKKYKKPAKSSSEILKEKQTRAETRLTKPGPEVMGKLDRF